MQCSFRVAIVGMGKVGATAAYAMLLDGTPTDLVLVGRDKQKVEGEKADLEDALPFLQSTNIIATDDYAQVAGADLTVVTAGAAQASGETRLDLAKKNLAIIDDIVPKIYAANPEGLVLVVSNPVDLLTMRAGQAAPWRPGQVFGSGTALDTARFRFHLSKLFHVNPKSVHAYILGEHGDSSFPLLSGATIGGQPLSIFPEYSAEKVLAEYEAARTAAYHIIEAKGATFYAIGAVIMTIMKAIYSDSQTVMPLSQPLHNYQGQSDVAMSVPCIICRHGIRQPLPVHMNETEQQQFAHSADVLKHALG